MRCLTCTVIFAALALSGCHHTPPTASVPTALTPFATHLDHPVNYTDEFASATTYNVDVPFNDALTAIEPSLTKGGWVTKGPTRSRTHQIAIFNRGKKESIILQDEPNSSVRVLGHSRVTLDTIVRK